MHDLRAGVVFGLVLVVAAAVLGGLLIYGLVLPFTFSRALSTFFGTLLSVKADAKIGFLISDLQMFFYFF